MILEQVQQVLAGGKHISIAEMVERIPELHEREEGAEILYLLLRLDRRFEQENGLWFTKVAVVDPKARIVAAAQDYFKAHPRGELTEHLVEAIVKATGEDSQRVREVILSTFRSVQSGKMILSRLLKE